MPQADSENTTLLSRRTPPRRRTPEPAPILLDPATLPDKYGMHVEGDCMAPEIPDGAYVRVDRRKPVKAGDLVVVWLKPEFVPAGQQQAGLKRLGLDIPPQVTFPWTDHPASDVYPDLILAQLNPPRQFALKCSKVLAVHRYAGLLSAEQVILPNAWRRRHA